MKFEQWQGFVSGAWSDDGIDVRDFIQKNYTPYLGDESFLCPATEKSAKLWQKILLLSQEERQKGGVLDADTKIISKVDSHEAGYIDKDLEVIVGLQTDKPFKRSLQPFGGIRVAEQALNEYGYEIDDDVRTIFKRYCKTHNQAVFDVYTPEMRRCRKAHILTGLPDSYGRGRIIGDYRRLPLYGADYLIAQKEKDKELYDGEMTDAVIKYREEIAEQIKSLKALKKMAAGYGYDVSLPAKDAKEAVQFLYFAYLAAIKDQNGAAMSFGRNTTFLDIYFERDIRRGVLTEREAQELTDQLVMKLRIVKFMRTKAYNELFSGDPTWVTESIGGMGEDGRTLVTKTAYRVLNTLHNLGPAPEPNLTVLWSPRLPHNFKRFCAELSVKTSSVQYQSDELIRRQLGDDYAIACCVSPMRVGKDMQFFGARANVAKCLLYAINGGKDELLCDEEGNPLQVSPPMPQITGEGALDFEQVKQNFRSVLQWLAKVYVNALNVIHYMHDRYAYEAIEMAFHDSDVRRFFATGIAGLSCAADSLSAIKYAKVFPVRKNGIAVDFVTEGDFPKYGNNDDRVDEIAVWILKTFYEEICKHKTYRNSLPTASVLTITSNVVYGKNTGNTPDGRKVGEPLAPGANPMHGRDCMGALASLESVAKLPFDYARDGISNTFSVTPHSLGESAVEKADNLINMLDGYMQGGGYHMNVNVFNRETLIDAQRHPEKYPQLTVRVSGYAVNFIKLTKEQQDEVIKRTIHEKM